jgi:hypothetical protein
MHFPPCSLPRDPIGGSIFTTCLIVLTTIYTVTDEVATNDARALETPVGEVASH